ncbi:MAG: hypothetical protein NDJ90_05370 [Oligoflexia bacterium]|nr:hypothetical protein [Oligoflexia bacterium]
MSLACTNASCGYSVHSSTEGGTITIPADYTVPSNGSGTAAGTVQAQITLTRTKPAAHPTGIMGNSSGTQSRSVPVNFVDANAGTLLDEEPAMLAEQGDAGTIHQTSCPAY